MITDNFLNIVLFEPEIPQNTGNVGRLCVGMNSKLHLIEPLGFEISDKAVKRAGLDYWPMLDLSVYTSLDHFFSVNRDISLYFSSTKAERIYYEAEFRKGDFILFGKESGGLPEIIHSSYKNRGLKIPMSDKIRSINLSNSVAVIMYEALRQIEV